MRTFSTKSEQVALPRRSESENHKLLPIFDATEAFSRLPWEETRIWGDSAYSGQRQTITDCAPRANDFTQAKGSRNRRLTEDERARNRNQSRVRARVEHSFGIIKRQFGFSTMRYRGLDKNAHRLFVVCALSNLVIAGKALLKRNRSGLQASCV